MLPLLFTTSAMASTAAALELLPLKRREERVVQKFVRIGKIGEAASMLAVERSSSGSVEASRGLRGGKGGAHWKAAKAMLLTGIALDLIPVWSTFKRRLGATLTTIGGLCLRFALLEAGKQAAREPRALLESQRTIPRPSGEGARRAGEGGAAATKLLLTDALTLTPWSLPDVQPILTLSLPLKGRGPLRSLAKGEQGGFAFQLATGPTCLRRLG